MRTAFAPAGAVVDAVSAGFRALEGSCICYSIRSITSKAALGYGCYLLETDAKEALVAPPVRFEF
jgi:hypothetical protein